MENQNKPGPTLEERTISGFPVSIGTSIWLESIFNPRLSVYDPNREIPNRIDLEKYENCFISIYTLFRNINGACSKEAFSRADAQDLANAIESEIDVIVSLFDNEGRGICKPVFYYNDYQEVIDKYTRKKILFRQDSTESQKEFSTKFLKAMNILFKNGSVVHEKFKGTIKGTSVNNSLMVTHVPYDLLSYKNFSRLDLLESHTGVLKPRFKWNSKYAPVGDHDLSNIPFLRRLLLIFGDRVLIKPNIYELRLKIVESAKNRNWTSFTSDVRVMYDLEKDIKEPMVLDFIKSL